MARIRGELRRKVAQRACRICEYCLIAEEELFLGCQCDHIISQKHGGKTSLANLAYSCSQCNMEKGTVIATLTSDQSGVVRLFNPRADKWREHFKLNGSEITGLSEIGAATIRMLGINRMERVAVRQCMMEGGRYPNAAAREIAGV